MHLELVYQIGRKLLDYYRKHKTYNLGKSNRRKKMQHWEKMMIFRIKFSKYKQKLKYAVHKPNTITT